MIRNILIATFLSVGLIASGPAIGEGEALPVEAEKPTAMTDSVQPQVDAAAADQAAQKREKITADAVAAVNETKQALQLLEEEKVDDALDALERATGKLELILARAPELALAPVDVEVVTHDLLADPDTVRAAIENAETYLERGEIQKARPLVANLASEIVFRTTSIPLATYPAAIKAVAPLLDDNEVDEARLALQAALNTLVVTTDSVIPLPVLRAEHLLVKAEELAESQERSEEDDAALAAHLDEARNQLELAELLGYGSRQAYKPIYEQLGALEERTAGGSGGKGWFDKIRQQLSQLI